MPPTLADYLFLQSYLTAEQQLLAIQNFQRPANTTAYTAPTATAAGSLIGQSAASAAANIPLAFTPSPIDSSALIAKGRIEFVQVWDTAPTAKSLRVHLIKGATAPAVTSLDGGVITFSGVARDKYLGFVDLVLQPGPFGGSQGHNDLIRIPYSLDQTTAPAEKVWTFLEALTPFAPGSGSTFYEALTVSRSQ